MWSACPWVSRRWVAPLTASSKRDSSNAGLPRSHGSISRTASAASIRKPPCPSQVILTIECSYGKANARPENSRSPDSCRRPFTASRLRCGRSAQLPPPATWILRGRARSSVFQPRSLPEARKYAFAEGCEQSSANALCRSAYWIRARPAKAAMRPAVTSTALSIAPRATSFAALVLAIISPQDLDM